VEIGGIFNMHHWLRGDGCSWCSPLLEFLTVTNLSIVIVGLSTKLLKRLLTTKLRTQAYSRTLQSLVFNSNEMTWKTVISTDSKQRLNSDGNRWSIVVLIRLHEGILKILRWLSCEPSQSTGLTSNLSPWSGIPLWCETAERGRDGEYQGLYKVLMV